MFFFVGHIFLEIQWNDSRVHIFREMYENKMEKINWRTDPLKKVSKTRIRNEFRTATGQNSKWLPLKKVLFYKKLYDIYCRLGCMTGVSFHETTKAIQMDDDWLNDRIQVIFEHHIHLLFFIRKV